MMEKLRSSRSVLDHTQSHTDEYQHENKIKTKQKSSFTERITTLNRCQMVVESLTYGCVMINLNETI